MKLLVFTQKLDRNDSVLGFFHGWLIKISEKCEKVYVICLQKGEYDLPNNVEVYSLGKENFVGRIGYILNLLRYLKRLDGQYEKVFVHMNQEYVLLFGLYWRLRGTPVYLWRNHPVGNIFTYIAVFLSNKVFCTSELSFTSRFKKTLIMPAGVDIDLYKPAINEVRKKYSICMVGRIAPVKNNLLALEAMQELVDAKVQVSLSIIGSYLDKDKEYFESLKKYVEDNELSAFVTFSPGVPPSKLPAIYSSFEVCLNLTDSGSFDKTIVESASCGAIPVVTNLALRGLLPQSCITDTNPKSVSDSIQKMLLPHERIAVQKDLEKFVESQSLSKLVTKLFNEI
jgi:glycosyltransferase involved in cell wall biosynthesis